MARKLHLDSYNYRNGENNNNGNPLSFQKLSWRQDKDESFSDWTIIVKTEDGAETEYSVHKVVLGTGLKQSEYFAKMFRTPHIKEATTRTSVITLDDAAAKAFPIMLDYIYSDRDALEASSEIATALRYLSNYFGVRALFERVNNFIRDDLIIDNLPVYVEAATLYNDDAMISTLIDYIVEDFAIIETDVLTKMDPDTFVKVVSLSSLKCDSKMLSEKVAEYLQSPCVEVNSTLVRSLTSSKLMPYISPSAAIYYAKLNEDHPPPDESDAKFEDSLLSRCARAFIESRVCSEIILPIAAAETASTPCDKSDNEMRKRKRSTEYESLSHNTRIKLLERAMYYERRKSAGSTLTVKGAGIKGANGTYKMTGSNDGVAMYEKKGEWGDGERTFSLFRYKWSGGKREWNISIVP